MPTARRPGMDHDLYVYSAIPDRPAFHLPKGKRVAVYVVLQIEYWELLAPEGAYHDPRFKGEFETISPIIEPGPIGSTATVLVCIAFWMFLTN